MTKKQKKTRNKLILTAVTLAAVTIFTRSVAMPWWAALLLFLVPYGYIGWDVLWSAARGVGRGQIFDEKFLMSVATLGALAIGEYPEAVFVMLFFKTGELFEKIAVGKSRRSISALMDVRPDSADVLREGEIRTVSPDEVSVGEIIVVRPGEKIPLDGIVTDGSSALDTKALTGESLPRDVTAGDPVVSGCVNVTGLLRVEVTKPYGESTVAKILDLVENSSLHKAKSESFITRFARVYTPAVVACAAAVGLIPPLFSGDWAAWIERALIFLVVSCPCALVISVPLSFFGGIGGASRRGILVKGAEHLESLSDVRTVVFDKTGTLTRGEFAVTAVRGEAETLELAALAEAFSDHPIARSLRSACEAPPDTARVTEVREIAGRGTVAMVDGRRVAVGNGKLMADEGADFTPATDIGTVVYVAADGRPLGHIVISDIIKKDARFTIGELKAKGVRCVMLTGDNAAVGKDAAARLGIDEAYCELLPADKVETVRRLAAQLPEGGKIAFVGDGINDAPVLALADIGVAMGALGSDAAIEAADVVLMDDRLSKIPAALSLSRFTRRVVRQNVAFALGVKFFVMALAVAGLSNMWLASFADVGVSALAILNATRTLYTSEHGLWGPR